MNYKLEKFWNPLNIAESMYLDTMNYKLEKFWNSLMFNDENISEEWTINLKSFEIHLQLFLEL